MRKTTMVLICLGLILLCCAHGFGQGPARGIYHVPKAEVVPKVGTPLQSTRMAATPMLASVGLPSSFRGDWKTDAFWLAPPPDASSAVLDPLPGWQFEDRLGDSRRKMDRWLITFGYGGDTYIFIRFDMGRVVTSQALQAADDSYLPSDLYGRLCIDGGGPILSAKAMLEMFFTFGLGKDGTYDKGQPFNFSVVQFNDFPLSGYEQNTAYLGTHKQIKLMVPTNQLRYPTMPPTGTPVPAPAWNMIVLKTNLTSLQNPNTNRPLVDNQTINFLFDSELRFKAMAPIFLVHGTDATPTTWGEPWVGFGENHPPDMEWGKSSFNDYFKPWLQGAIPFPGICFNDITLTPNGPIDDADGVLGNSTILTQQITERLASVGAKACHIIAHSKGGIDSRAMIQKYYKVNHYNEHLERPGHFEVLSLYTLDTPHRGTVLSDIAWNVQHSVDVTPNAGLNPNGSWNEDLARLIGFDFRFLHTTPDGQPDGLAKVPSGHALEAQMTSNMAKWNSKNPFNFSNANSGRPIRFYNTVSDADWHERNQSICDLEAQYMGIPFNSVATSIYRMLYWAREVKAETVVHNNPTQPSNNQIIITVLKVPDNWEPGQWNDLCVTYQSALYDGGTLFCPLGLQNYNNIQYKNHSTVKTYGLAQGIVKQIALDWPVTGP